jgi:hypothetical protein
MQMIRHDLRLIQSCVREMIRYRMPALIHDTAHVIQCHHRIRSIAHNTPEQFLSLRGA